jgi:hypothetical protein
VTGPVPALFVARIFIKRFLFGALEAWMRRIAAIGVLFAVLEVNWTGLSDLTTSRWDVDEGADGLDSVPFPARHMVVKCHHVQTRTSLVSDLATLDRVGVELVDARCAEGINGVLDDLQSKCGIGY